MAIATGKLKSLISKLFAIKSEWAGYWSDRFYRRNSISYDNGFLGITNKGTSDRLAPQQKGAFTYLYEGLITTTSILSKQVTFGQRYTTVEPLFISAYRVYTITGNLYDIYSITDPTGEQNFRLLLSLEATETGWQEITIDTQTINTNTVFDVVAVVSEPSPTPVETLIVYDYSTPNNPIAPSSGEIIHADKSRSLLFISKTDDGGTDQTAFLSTLTTGDIISGGGVSWSIQSTPTDEGSYYSLAVAPSLQGSPDGAQTFTFETVVATPITYAEDLNYWSGSTIVQGLFSSDNAIDRATNDNAYGIDIKVTPAIVSDDWDLMAFSNIGFSDDSGSSGIQGISTSFLIETLPAATTNNQFNTAPVTALNQTLPLEGRYFVTLGFEISCSAINRSAMVGFYIDGVLIDNVFSQEMKDSNNLIPVSKTIPYEFNGSANFRVDFGKLGGGGASVTIENIRITGVPR